MISLKLFIAILIAVIDLSKSAIMMGGSEGIAINAIVIVLSCEALVLERIKQTLTNVQSQLENKASRTLGVQRAKSPIMFYG